MKSVVDILLDPKDDRNVLLYVDEKEVEFAQIANIELDGELYTFLEPLSQVEGVSEGEGILFQFVLVDNKYEIVMVRDDDLIDRVYQEYLQMLDN